MFKVADKSLSPKSKEMKDKILETIPQLTVQYGHQAKEKLVSLTSDSVQKLPVKIQNEILMTGQNIDHLLTQLRVSNNKYCFHKIISNKFKIGSRTCITVLCCLCRPSV